MCWKTKYVYLVLEDCLSSFVRLQSVGRMWKDYTYIKCWITNTGILFPRLDVGILHLALVISIFIV